LLATIRNPTRWLPAFLVIALRRGYQRIAAQPWTTGLGWGVAAAGGGLLAALVVSLCRTSLAGWKEAALALVVLVMLFRGIRPVLVIALAAAAGAVLL
jgi:chromate transport protein ChrA